jgi:hypothetical protein
MEERKRQHSRSRRAYALLLASYPPGFRREYGREMARVFADLCRESAGGAALARVWAGALADLALTAPRLRLEEMLEGGALMSKVRTVALALAAYAFTLLVVAPLFVRNARSMPNFVAHLTDALIFTGLVFNLVFQVLTLPRWFEGVRAVRAALALTTCVIGVLMFVSASSEGPHAPHLNLFIIVAQVLSLLVWFTAHMWWVLRRRGAATPATVAGQGG